MFRVNVFSLVFLFLLAPHVHAKSEPGTDAVEANSYENFVPLVAAIRGEMTVGGRYEFLRGMDRDSVNEKLDAMAVLLQSSGTVADMLPDARMTLMADQDAVNQLLAKFADDRLICTFEAPIGSLIPKKRCRTLRQIEKSRSRSKGQIMDIQRDSSLGNE
ncbi:hypothetical protein [Dokdonella sp.]|uniref:hypothetical protein n=1 Tax=Dokdonella sp. TaxID=2291710 RepID=UPI0035298172